MIFRVRGINKVRAKGRLYYYHRRTGKRIEAPYGTDAFALEVMRLNNDGARERPHRKDGTLGGLITAYREGPEFQELAARTRSDYQKIFDYLKPMDGVLVERMTGPGVLKIRDKAFKRHKRRFANYVLQVLSLLFTWGKPRGWCEHNPATGIKKVRRPRDARKVNRAWKDWEVATVLERAPKGALKEPIAIGLFTGLREADVLKVAKTKYDGKAFGTRAAKNGRDVWIPAHPLLRRILNEAPRSDATTLVTGSRGKPYTQSGFQSRFFKFIKKLERHELVDSGLTFHGLRHTTGRLIIEAGGTIEDVMEILAVTRETADRYAAEANRMRRAKATLVRLGRHKRSFGKAERPTPMKQVANKS